MTCKKGIHKVSEKNITKFVSSLSYLSSASATLKKDYDMDQQAKFSKPSYQTEITKIIQQLNTDIGITWKAATHSNSSLRILNQPVFLKKNYPWVRIDAAIGEFEEWFDNHAEIFRIDHTFSRSNSNGNNLDILE